MPFLEDPKMGKNRPCVVLKQNSKTTDILPITSKYRHKSSSLKVWFFKIHNWKEAGLPKPSWVELNGQQPINNKYVHHNHLYKHLDYKTCMDMFAKGIRLQREKSNVLKQAAEHLHKIRSNPKLMAKLHEQNVARKKHKFKAYKLHVRHHKKYHKHRKSSFLYRQQKENASILKAFDNPHMS